ncbi:MAG: leucyl/phenylalanyl-tRNA--protein transferase [Spirochaetales bacterium]|nr:leucyl/phenylalanyl-tRNA--protein transferase [Spirochaetales bacterium]
MFPYYIPPWAKYPYFPQELLPDNTGLVALGGKLSSKILVEAYSKGIFPWSGEDPIPWYSPDPRLVLFPQKFHAAKRLQRLIKQNYFQIAYDNDFESVIHHCASVPRRNQPGTWIDGNIIKAYTELYYQKIAHSVEVYHDNKLVGGLYGLYIGECFFGESMFSLVDNASKIAVFYLCRKLLDINGKMIDCQQETPHMKRLGADLVSRHQFLNLLEMYTRIQNNFLSWKE